MQTNGRSKPKVSSGILVNGIHAIIDENITNANMPTGKKIAKLPASLVIHKDTIPGSHKNFTLSGLKY